MWIKMRKIMFSVCLRYPKWRLRATIFLSNNEAIQLQVSGINVSSFCYLVEIRSKSGVSSQNVYRLTLNRSASIQNLCTNFCIFFISYELNYCLHPYFLFGAKSYAIRVYIISFFFSSCLMPFHCFTSRIKQSR